VSHYNNKQFSDGLLSYNKASPSYSLTMQLTLYEYHVDRKQAQREVWDLTDTLRFHTLSDTERALIHHYRAFGSMVTDVVVLQFCEALKTLEIRST
jgi:hypothetical protein